MTRCKNAIVYYVIYLIFVIFAAAPVLAGDAVVGSVGSGQMENGSQPATEFSITASSDITDWVLFYSSEANTCPFVLQVSAEDLSTITKIHMTEWYGGNYGSEKLFQPMRFSDTSSNYIEIVDEVELPVGGVIAVGIDTSNQPIVLSVKFKQPVL